MALSILKIVIGKTTILSSLPISQCASTRGSSAVIVVPKKITRSAIRTFLTTSILPASINGISYE